jgi:hypothetical protein
MRGDSNRPKRVPTRAVSETLVDDTVAVVMHLIREQPSPAAVATAQTLWLAQQVLSSMTGKEGSHDTHDTYLRIQEAKFADWASHVREGFRGGRRRDKS